jgi:hypothetical protein
MCGTNTIPAAAAARLPCRGFKVSSRPLKTHKFVLFVEPESIMERGVDRKKRAKLKEYIFIYVLL